MGLFIFFFFLDQRVTYLSCNETVSHFEEEKKISLKYDILAEQLFKYCRKISSGLYQLW